VVKAACLLRQASTRATADSGRQSGPSTFRLGRCAGVDRHQLTGSGGHAWQQRRGIVVLQVVQEQRVGEHNEAPWQGVRQYIEPAERDRRR
jgi:hypothetical protein